MASHEPGLHGHRHEHPQAGEHRHPHHHAGAGAAHEHAHPLGLERYTYLVSPIHDLDPRFKIVAALVVILGVVGGPSLRPAEAALIALALLAVTVISRVPLAWMLARSATVLPVAVGIALFAPMGRAATLDWPGIAGAYATHGMLVWSIASKAWLSAYVVLLVTATTPMPDLLAALRVLKMPSIFITLLTFLYRFADVFRAQLVSMRRAVASRAPSLGGTGLVRLYGNLGGSLFIRAYERGERIHAAMLARGYTGVLPGTHAFAAGPSDWLLVGTAVLVAAAAVLY